MACPSLLAAVHTAHLAAADEVQPVAVEKDEILERCIASLRYDMFVVFRNDIALDGLDAGLSKTLRRLLSAGELVQESLLSSVAGFDDAHPESQDQTGPDRTSTDVLFASGQVRSHLCSGLVDCVTSCLRGESKKEANARVVLCQVCAEKENMSCDRRHQKEYHDSCHVLSFFGLSARWCSAQAHAPLYTYISAMRVTDEGLRVSSRHAFAPVRSERGAVELVQQSSKSSASRVAARA